MSDEWINQTISEMMNNPNMNALGNVLNNNKNKILKTVTGIDKSTSEIVVIKLTNY